MKKTLFALIACASTLIPTVITANKSRGIPTPFTQANQFAENHRTQSRNATYWSLAGALAFTTASTGVAVGTHVYREAIITAASPYLTQPGARAATWAVEGFGGLSGVIGTLSASVNAWLLWGPRDNRF